VPVKKSEYIERIGKLLNMDLELLESLEKVNKLVLIALERGLTKEIDPKSDAFGVNLDNCCPKSEQVELS
jgi:hypothetical protein